MTIQPINSMRAPVRIQGVRRVARRAKSENTEEVAPEDPPAPKRANPPGVGENLDITV